MGIKSQETNREIQCFYSNTLSPPLHSVSWSRLTQRIDKRRNAAACSKAKEKERPRDPRARANDQKVANGEHEPDRCSQARRFKSRPARREAFLPMRLRQRNC